jgi:hypothetical protein
MTTPSRALGSVFSVARRLCFVVSHQVCQCGAEAGGLLAMIISPLCTPLLLTLGVVDADALLVHFLRPAIALGPGTLLVAAGDEDVQFPFNFLAFGEALADVPRWVNLRQSPL